MFNLLTTLASRVISASITLLMGATNINVSTTPVEYEDVSVIEHWSDLVDYVPVYEIRAAQTAAKRAAFDAAYDAIYYDTYGIEPVSISIPTPSTHHNHQGAQERVQAYEAVMSSYDQFPVTEHLNTGCYGALQVHEGVVQKQDKRGHAALLEREYAVLSALQGTGLVPGQVSYSNGVLSMEYIHAASLDYYHRCMEAGLLDYIQYTSILDAVGAAVKAFHTAGWVHNDLHPGNILITLPDGGEWRAVLIDVAFSTSATHAFPEEMGTAIFASGWQQFYMSQEGDIDSLKCHIKVPYLDRVFS